MIRKRRRFVVAFGGALLATLTACKVSDDAIAASRQMTTTANSWSNYYAALDAEVSDTISLFELDAAISGISYGEEDRKLQEATRSELKDRKELAGTLAKAASAMTNLSNAKAATDVQNAATELGNELIKVKALPGGSPVPDALGKAGNVLLQIIQQHEEKKAAQAMDETLKAVTALFEQEKPAYDSIARTHDREASVVAQGLISSNAVDLSPMLAPALKPFSLAPLPLSPSYQASLKALALSRLRNATEEATQNEQTASAGMLDALREMSSRVHSLATEKPMPIRGEPFSLKLVENWAQSWSASLL